MDVWEMAEQLRTLIELEPGEINSLQYRSRRERIGQLRLALDLEFARRNGWRRFGAANYDSDVK